MNTLTYIEPEAPSRPFAKGDTVEVLDREHKVLGTQQIVRVNKASVETDCGRRWRKDGWWIGSEQAWPFPSIRHLPRGEQDRVTGK